MKDEDIIGQEFECVEFEDVPNLTYGKSLTGMFTGRAGTVINIHDSKPHICLVRFDKGIGPIGERYFPVSVVKQQIEDRIPIDLDDLFKQIKSL